MLIYERKKRVKRTELSDSEIINEDAGSSSQSLPHRITPLGQSVEFESVKSPRLKSTSKHNVISMEIVENMEEAIDCCLDCEKTFSSNGGKVLVDKSNAITSENRDVDMLILMLHEENPHKTENDVIFNVVSSETHTGEFPSSDPSLPLDHNEQSFLISNDASIINTTSCDSNILGNKLFEEHANVTAEENIEKFHNVSSGDADPSSSQLDGDFSSQVDVERAFVGYWRKKLLVLDVNGLLVHISSYVPYDYDPDDIILKKAVFKRPFCDDFLKFCFERFNVGVWTAKTKRNMEPILDFLLGNDKHNLLFCWDQSQCTYTGFYTVEKRYKPLLLKKLKKLWEKFEPDLPWKKGEYNESNTLLIDDSPYKALCNPRCTAIFPYTYHFRHVRDNSLGPEGDIRVYLEGLAMAENVQEYVKQHPFGQRQITERNLSWGYYLKVIEASSSPPRQTHDES